MFCDYFQTKLHDSICEKRQTATIATHDMKSVKLPLKYTAQFPQLLQVRPRPQAGGLDGGGWGFERRDRQQDFLQ